LAINPLGASMPTGYKILMVTRESGSDRRYGLGKSLAPIVDELHARGIAVTYLTQADAGARSYRFLRNVHRTLIWLCGWTVRATDVSVLAWFLLERINMGRLAAKVARAHQIDCVHCHDPIIAAGYLWFRPRRARKLQSVGLTQHGFGSYTQAFHEDGTPLGPRAMRWLRGWERRVLARVDWVHVPTHYGQEQLARDLGRYPFPPHWHVIPHPRPQIANHDRLRSREQLRWSPEALYIIAVGRIVPLKRLSMLLRGCAGLTGGDWRLALIGEGDVDALRALAESLHITHRVEFAVTDDVSLYYSAADIYVSTSATESFGLANLEAITAGLPSLCTAVGGTPEVLGSGAWLIPCESLPALTSALQSLVEDQDLRSFWAQQAKTWSRCWPDRSEVATTYLSMYRGEATPPLTADGAPIPKIQLPFDAWRSQSASWPICPLPPTLVVPGGGKALVLAPHHDDETLGCGGTLARLCQAGWHVRVVVVTDGALGDPNNYLNGRDVVQHRRRETQAAARSLGIDDVIFWDEPDGHFAPSEAVSERLSEMLDEFTPDWLFVPPVLDFHRDHIGTSLIAVEQWSARGCRERLFFYELWQPLPANWLIDVTPVLGLKRQAIAEYRLPMRYQDYSAAFDGLMRYRALYLGPNAGTHAETLLEVDAGSWRPIIASLMRLRAAQFSPGRSRASSKTPPRRNVT
jgi:LmbE family N-acetylglucosaminyl deacetylase/glycosyltransferase involved in cell wall biosynthesis